MNTPTLILHARRVVAKEISGGMILAAFMPTKATIQAFVAAESGLAIVDLQDETGTWSNGRNYEVHEVSVSQDGRAMSVHLML